MAISANAQLLATVSAATTKPGYNSTLAGEYGPGSVVRIKRDGVAKRVWASSGLYIDSGVIRFAALSNCSVFADACNPLDGAAWTLEIERAGSLLSGVIGTDFTWAGSAANDKSGGFLASASITPPASLPNGAPPSSNIIKIASETTTLSNYRLSFGRWFAQGVIAGVPKPQFQAADLAQWQATVKNRWPDGSVRHAIFAIVVPSLTTTESDLTFVNAAASPAGTITDATVLASDMQVAFNVTMRDPDAVNAWPAFNASANTTKTFPTIALQGTVPTARSLLAAGHYQLWEDGPVKKTYILYNQGTRFGNANRPDVATCQYVLEVWYNGLYEYTARLLNESPSKARALFFDYTISHGLASPTTAVTKAGSDTYPGFMLLGSCAPVTPQTYGPGVQVGIKQKHGWEYFRDQRLMPNFRTDFTSMYLRDNQVNQRAAAAQHIWAMGGYGSAAGQGWDQGTAGGGVHRAVFHDHQLVALSNGGSNIRKIIEEDARLQSSYHCYLIEDVPTRLAGTRKYDEVANVDAVGRWCSRDGRKYAFLYEGNGYWHNLNASWNTAPDRFTQADESWNPGFAGNLPYTYGLWMSRGAATGYMRADYQHQPNLTWLPYLMTGHYDFYFDQMAKGHWDLFTAHNDTETHVAAQNNRAMAFTLLGITHTALMAVDGTVEKTYFSRVQDEAYAGALRRKNQPLPAGAIGAITAYYNARAADPEVTAAGASPLKIEYFGNGGVNAKGQWWTDAYMISTLGWVWEMTANIYALQKLKMRAEHWIGFVQQSGVSLPSDAWKMVANYASPASDSAGVVWQTWLAAYNGMPTSGPPDNAGNQGRNTDDWAATQSDLDLGYANVACHAASYFVQFSGGTAVWTLLNSNNSATWSINPKWAAQPRA